jgi:hypothetical protein
MADTRAGILLYLKDQFSRGVKDAGISAKEFGATALGAVEKVNGAFSGLAGTLGTLGVSLGALSAVKSTIDLEDRLTRLGLTADASAAQVNDLKRQIFDAAQLPHIKLDPSEIIGALEVVMTKTGDLEYAAANIENIAMAIQATGEGGEAMGSVFSEFQKFGYSAGEISALMDDLVKQGDRGAFTFGEFAKSGSAILSAYSPIGTTPDDIRRANAAMQILTAGTKNPTAAVTALGAAMAELGDPAKQAALKEMKISVRDDLTGEFRDFNDIMADVIAKADEAGNTDFLGTIFGMNAMEAVRAYANFGDLYEGLMDLGDTTGAILEKSATMAGTLKSNLRNVQTAFQEFADKNLTAPLKDVSEFLNTLAEDPERTERYIRNITSALAALATLRIGAQVVSFMANLKSLQGGSPISVPEAPGNGMPVRVTNWPSGGGGAPFPAGGDPGATPPLPGVPGMPDPRARNAAAASHNALQSGIITAMAITLQQGFSALQKWRAADADDTLSGEERGKAKGGAAGEAAGATLGGFGGALAASVLAAKVGAAVGTAIAPGIGTVIGGLGAAAGGALAGALGGLLGKKAGEFFGAGMARNDIAGRRVPRRLEQAVYDEVTSVSRIPPRTGNPVLEGEAVMRLDVNISEDRATASLRTRRNSLPMRFETGRVLEARSAVP